MKTSNTVAILGYVILLLGIVGWITNLVLLIQSNDSVGMLIARGIGVLVAPFGSILGLLSFF